MAAHIHKLTLRLLENLNSTPPVYISNKRITLQPSETAIMASRSTYQTVHLLG